MGADVDKDYMQKAIVQAKKAQVREEVPIGAVAVVNGKIMASAYNIREATHNPLGHAEILLLERLAKKQKSWRLEDATIYVTCEPCIMCAGAMLQARISRVVYGCKDPKAGAFGSLYDFSQDKRLNHRIEVVAGVMADDCAALLGAFFKRLREM